MLQWPRIPTHAKLCEKLLEIMWEVARKQIYEKETYYKKLKVYTYPAG